MPETNSKEMDVMKSGAHVIGALENGRMKVYRATVDLKGQAVGDTVLLCHLDEGQFFVAGLISSSVSLDTAEISIGTKDDAEYYKGAGAFTTPNVPTLFGREGAKVVSVPVGGTDVFMTVSAAALPASGQMIVEIITASV